MQSTDEEARLSGVGSRDGGVMKNWGGGVKQDTRNKD